MGAPMARNLHKAGLLAAVWNRSGEKAQALGAELGVATPRTLAEFARGLDAVVICVSADADVRFRFERLQMAVRAAGFGLWEYDVERKTSTWDEMMYEIYGVAPGTPVTLEVFRSALHPEDVEEVVGDQLDKDSLRTC